MHYIVDSKGVKTSVVVPYTEWEKINNDYLELQNKLKVILAIKDGLNEIKKSKKNKKQLPLLSDFLNESKS